MEKHVRDQLGVSRTKSKSVSIIKVRLNRVSSVPPKVKRLAKAIRDHWGIENSLHWVLDVVFAEDDSRIRKGNGPETTATLGDSHSRFSNRTLP